MLHPAVVATCSVARSSGRDLIAMSAANRSVPAAPRLLPQSGGPLPAAAALAALGTVLCQYRPALGGEAAGWTCATTVATQTRMDSDGPRESLWFFDRQGQCCWRLYLLPDSDFLAWDRLIASVPDLPAMDAEAGVCERLWRRLARRMRGELWCLSAVRLHAVAGHEPALTPSLAPLSALGVALLRRIALDEALEPPMAFVSGGTAAAVRQNGPIP